jgi:hypothetical protein
MQRQDSTINGKWPGGLARLIRGLNPADSSKIMANLLMVFPWMVLVLAPAAMAFPLPPLTTSRSGDFGAPQNGAPRPMRVVPPSSGAMAVGHGVGSGPRRLGVITPPSMPGPVASFP